MLVSQSFCKWTHYALLDMGLSVKKGCRYFQTRAKTHFKGFFSNWSYRFLSRNSSAGGVLLLSLTRFFMGERSSLEKSARRQKAEPTSVSPFEWQLTDSFSIALMYCSKWDTCSDTEMLLVKGTIRGCACVCVYILGCVPWPDVYLAFAAFFIFCSTNLSLSRTWEKNNKKNQKQNHTHINKECVDLQCVHVCVHVHEGEVVVIHLLTQHTHRGQTWWHRLMAATFLCENHHLITKNLHMKLHSEALLPILRRC